MDFTLTQRNEWHSTDPPGGYRITYVTEVQGVLVRPHYHAVVWVQGFRFRIGDGQSDAHRMWWFAGRRGPYYSINTAMAACQRHYKIWLRAIQIAKSPRKGRMTRLGVLQVKARTGKGAAANPLLTSLPVWAFHSVSHVTLAKLYPQGRPRRSVQSA